MRKKRGVKSGGMKMKWKVDVIVSGMKGIKKKRAESLINEGTEGRQSLLVWGWMP